MEKLTDFGFILGLLNVFGKIQLNRVSLIKDGKKNSYRRELMNIKEYARIKQDLKIRMVMISDDVEKRWQALIGLGHGYFHGWHLEGDIVEVKYKWPESRDDDTDDIPMRFFEIEGELEAVKKYKAFLEEKREKQKKIIEDRKREGRKKHYEELKKEFERRD